MGAVPRAAHPASVEGEPTRRGRAMRSVERVHVGCASAVGRRLRTVSERHGYPVEVDERYGRVRTWMRRRESELPTVEGHCQLELTVLGLG
ncbi:hypothetical protein [Streptomyces sp. NBC_01236]|uniref:hypothetical protein n=1 Tax=Streptomyces sp. NBC_01236 TaxID=2903789 RepID=UPI002E0E5F2C|nr:hypothetical protein OG324_51055 [Streptomyces sp. NBC_01236]